MYKLLFPERIVVALLDNNQRGYCKAHQRDGVSNKFVKVTGRTFTQFNDIPSFSHDNQNYNINMCYIGQLIPSPSPMLPFETIISGELEKSNAYVAAIADIILLSKNMILLLLSINMVNEFTSTLSW